MPSHRRPSIVIGIALAVVLPMLPWPSPSIVAGAPSSVRPGPTTLEPEPPAFPPIVFDDFQRTVSGGWGTSTSGVAWVDNSLRENGQTSAAAGNTISVDGSSGRLDYGGQAPIFMLASDGAWQEPAFGLTGRFRVDALPTGPNNLSSVYFWLFKDAPDPYGDAALLHIRVGDDAVPPGVGGVQLGGTIGDPNQASLTKTDWQANTDYCVRWVHRWGDLSRAKVWRCADAEPADWQLERDASTDTYQTGDNVVLQLVAFPDDPGTTWFDDIALYQPSILEVEPVPPGTASNPPYVNSGTAGDPVSTLTGAFSHTFLDTAVAGRGPTVAFARSYNSNDPRVGPLGSGWTHNYEARVVDPGDGSGDVVLVGPQGRRDTYSVVGSSFTPPDGVHTELVQELDGSFTATGKSQVTWRFNPSGRLVEIRDRYGNASALGYDTNGRLATIGDPAGRGSLTLGYTGDRLTSVTDWASPARTVGYAYDGQGRLWKVTDREGKVATLGYDGTSARLASITDARGNVALSLSYDAAGRVAAQQDAQGLVSGATTTFAYVVNGDGTRVTTATAPSTSFELTFNPSIVDSYSADGLLTTRVVRPSSTETLNEAYAYDGLGNRTAVTDARGATTTFCYDRAHDGSTLSTSRGNLTRVIGPPPTGGADRPVTLLQYDTADNLIQTVSPMGVASGPTPTCASDLTGFDADFATDLAYDAAKVLLLAVTSRYTDPDLGARTALTKYEYGDAANPGMVTRLIPPRGNIGASPDYAFATTYGYYGSGNRAGLLERVTDALGNATTFDYDPVGRLTSSVDPLGNAPGGVAAEHRSEFTFDKEDRVRFVKLPAPSAGGGQLSSETRYDDVGNAVVRIDANGQVTSFVYDERDSLQQVKESPTVWTDPASPPSGVITTDYDYDAGGNLIRMIRAMGDATYERVTDYAFDGRGLVRRETQYPAWPSTTPTLVATSAYDPNGNLLVATDQLGRTTTMTHDALDRLTAIDYSQAATPDVAYAYDRNDRRTQMVDGTGTTTYGYDEIGRPTTIASPGSTVVGYRYDRDGHRSKLIYPDATAVTYAFDAAGRMSGLTDWASRAVAYTYFPDGALKDATNPDGSVTTYGYDNARRLLDVVHTKGTTTLADHAYTLDPVGNVSALTEFVAGITAAAGWSSGVRVNDDAGTADQTAPSLATDDDGTVTAAWQDTRSGSAIFASRRAVGSAWSSNALASDSTTGARSAPQLATDGAGNVYAVWVDGRNGRKDIYFAKRSAASGTWSANVRVNTATTFSDQTSPDISVKSDGAAVAVWFRKVGNNKYHIFSARLAPGATAWGAEIKVTSDQNASKTGSRVTVGADGTAYAVWTQPQTGDANVWFATLAPGASTWTGIVKISDDPGTAFQGSPDIGVDGAGNLTVVWDDARSSPHQLRVRARPAGGSWAASTVIAADGANEPSLSVRADGAAIVAWYDGSNALFPNVSTSERSTATGTWSTPVQQSEHPGTKPASRPAVTNGTNGATIAWQSGTNVSGDYDYDILARTVEAGTGSDAFGYGYDRLYRLTSVANPGDDATYAYDPVGNRLSRVLGSSTTTYAYDRSDRITAAGAAALTVNAVGATTARGADTFAYDQINRLTSATVGSTTETYAYDGDGVRFSRQVGAGPLTRYVTDPMAGLPVTIADGGRKYVWGLGLAYAVSGSAIEVYHADRLGSVRVITDAAGAVTASYRSDEFGIPVASSGSSAQPFRFTGEPLDASGLTYLRARYYDAGAGRLLTRDAWGGSSRDTQSLNRFAYAHSNPATNTDPSGHCIADTALDVVFVGSDLVSLAFGPEKERQANAESLALNSVGLFITCVAGLGVIRRVAGAADAALGASAWANRLAHLSPDVVKLVDDAIERARVGKIQFPTHDGKVFLNSAGGLPDAAPGYYTEWTAAAASSKRGQHRVIVGGDPSAPTELWYWDHVSTYVQLFP